MIIDIFSCVRQEGAPDAGGDGGVLASQVSFSVTGAAPLGKQATGMALRRIHGSSNQREQWYCPLSAWYPRGTFIDAWRLGGVPWSRHDTGILHQQPDLSHRRTAMPAAKEESPTPVVVTNISSVTATGRKKKHVLG